jgi:hypothetical protein
MTGFAADPLIHVNAVVEVRIDQLSLLIVVLLEFER